MEGLLYLFRVVDYSLFQRIVCGVKIVVVGFLQEDVEEFEGLSIVYGEGRIWEVGMLDYYCFFLQ